MKSHWIARLIVTGLFMLPARSATSADWPAFRGPNASGIADTTGLPMEFGPTLNVVWQTTLPLGASSPVVTEQHIFLTGAGDKKLETLCLERSSGKILWRRSVPPSRAEALHQLNNPASPTPVTDGKNVYVFFGDFGLVSYSADGTERWQLPLGPFANLHGMAASPILSGDLLFMLCDQDSESFLLAIHKDTGKIAWRTVRPEAVHGFATPSVFHTRQGSVQVIVPGSYQLTAYSSATGERLWWVRGLTWQVKPTAVVTADTIYVTGWAPGADAGERQNLPPFEEVLKEGDKDGDGKLSPTEVPERLRHTGSWNAIDLGRDGFLDGRDWSFYRARRSAQNVTMAVRPGDAKGDLTDTHVLWQIDRSVPVVSSPLLYKDVLYTIKDGGILSALDPASGKIHKQARLPGAIDSYYSSPVAADSKIFVVSETGKLSVVKAGKEWELLSLNDLNEACYATPALADGRMYLRTQTKLYCFGKP